MTDRVRVGQFTTLRGFFYRGELLEETSTHYKIHDIKTNSIMELLKTSVERIVWEGEAV